MMVTLQSRAITSSTRSTSGLKAIHLFAMHVAKQQNNAMLRADLIEDSADGVAPFLTQVFAGNDNDDNDMVVVAVSLRLLNELQPCSQTTDATTAALAFK